MASWLDLKKKWKFVPIPTERKPAMRTMREYSTDEARRYSKRTIVGLYDKAFKIFKSQYGITKPRLSIIKRDKDYWGRYKFGRDVIEVAEAQPSKGEALNTIFHELSHAVVFKKVGYERGDDKKHSAPFFEVYRNYTHGRYPEMIKRGFEPVNYWNREPPHRMRLLARQFLRRQDAFRYAAHVRSAGYRAEVRIKQGAEAPYVVFTNMGLRQSGEIDWTGY